MSPRLLCVLGVLGGGIPVWAQPARLEFSDRLRLVDCSPSSSVPCFRLKANIVDAQGNPVSPALSPQLAKSLTVQADEHEITPFYAVAGSGSGAAVRSRIALVVLDVSGSMNQLLDSGQSRYAAAKAAALQFLEGFENGADRVAIVSFESHNVQIGRASCRERV